MEELLSKIRNTIILTSEIEEYLYSISTLEEVPKGQLLIRQGEPVRKTYFVTDGCLRSFCTDPKGKQHTLQFAIKGWWISDFIAIYNKEPATLSVETITDAKIIAFQAKELEEIFTIYPEFEVFQRKNLQKHVVSLHKRILNQLQLTARERYELFLEQYPDIEQYTPNYHIASFLGITQQSLSRIRVEKAGL